MTSRENGPRPDSNASEPHKPDARDRDAGVPGSEESFSERRTMMRLASAGFELASFSLILGGAGYAVDRWMGNLTPYFAIAGLLLGFSLGFYRLIVLANRLS